MSKLAKLRAKRRKRVKSRKYHFAKRRRLKFHGRKLRAKWHLVRFNRDKKAIRKLNRLIAKEVKSRRIDWNGCPELSYEPIRQATRLALEVANGLYVTATTNGTHSPTSWHYQSRAVDFGSGGPGEEPEKEAQQALLDAFGAGHFAELFGPDGWYIKNGVKYPGVFPGHADHLHVAIA